jgi:hypothetical protein
VDRANVLHLLRRECTACPIHEEFGVAHNRLQRRAQFVTHHRQELARGAVRCLSCCQRLAQSRLGLLALGDVCKEDGQSLR